MAAVLKSVWRNYAIELARTATHATVLHFKDGPFVIETMLLGREFDSTWLPCTEVTPQGLAKKWLYHPLGIALRGSESAREAIRAIAAGEEVVDKKVEKAERINARAEQPSSKAREILRKYDLGDKKISTPFYDECEAAGIDRKLAASVLCIERKKRAAPVFTSKTKRATVKVPTRRTK